MRLRAAFFGVIGACVRTHAIAGSRTHTGCCAAEALVERCHFHPGTIAALESLDDDALWDVMFERVPEDEQEEIEDLLHRNQAGTSSDADRDQLAALQHSTDRVMLRKARAAVLLRFRGRRIPTLAELRRETPPAR